MSKWVVRPVKAEKKKAKQPNVWIAKLSDGSVVRQPVCSSSSGRMRQKGTVATQKARRQQLNRDLSKARQERLRKAIGGELEPRSANGERVEKLTAVEPSETYEPEAAAIIDPPLRRRSKQVEEGDEHSSYASDIVEQRPTINGRRQTDSIGGNYPGADVRPLN